MTTRVLNISNFLLVFLLATFSLTLLLSCGRQGPRSHRQEFGNEGWIGIYVQDLDRELKRYLDVRESGVLVSDIVSDSPAEKAGLQKRDIIVKFDGRRIRSSRDLTRIVQRSQPGDKLKIEIIRDGSRKKFTLQIGEKQELHFAHGRSEHDRAFGFAFGGRRAWLGIQTAELNKDLANYFDVDEDDGVLVVSVVEDSPAEKAGIKSGDVIMRLDDEKVRTTEDVVELLRDYGSGEEIEVEIKRNSRNLRVNAQLTRSHSSSSYEFNYCTSDDCQHDRHSDWKDWGREMKGWGRSERKHLEELESRIRDKIDRQVRREIEIPLQRIDDEIRMEMESAGRELEREMRHLQDELHELDIRFKFDESL